MLMVRWEASGDCWLDGYGVPGMNWGLWQATTMEYSIHNYINDPPTRYFRRVEKKQVKDSVSVINYYVCTTPYMEQTNI